MAPIELRDLDAARRFVAEGLWLQRAAKPSRATVRAALEWAMEVASGGQPLPPVGFVADVGHIAFGSDSEQRSKVPMEVPGWPPALARMYEDHVLGKLYVDALFERAGTALQQYQGKDRIKGLGYVVNQIRERAGIGGVLLPPAAIRGLLNANPDEVLASAWDGLMRDGPSALLLGLYDNLVSAGRRVAEVLVKEDIEALEDRSALGDMGQYVALRQIRQTAAKLVSLLPIHPVRPYPNRREVPTPVLDEDQYPVGGYTAIATKGSIESLLHSQLAYIEDDPTEPDLFDLKYARDELFYYSRDENQFFRRRRAFAFVLYPKLVEARFKDAELPCQRIVLIQASILAIVEKLTDWLSADAIHFEVHFVQDGDKKPLAEEMTLMKLLLHERIDRKECTIAEQTKESAIARLGELAQKAQVHALIATTAKFVMDADRCVVNELVVASQRPQLFECDGSEIAIDGASAEDVWQETVLRILQLWV